MSNLLVNMLSQLVNSAVRLPNAINVLLNFISAQRISDFLGLKEEVQGSVSRNSCAESAVALLKRRESNYRGLMDVCTEDP